MSDLDLKLHKLHNINSNNFQGNDSTYQAVKSLKLKCRKS